jgi:hypothetical protein
MASLTVWTRGLLLAIGLVLAAPATALADCGTNVINDYLNDGTINGTYTIPCYQQALGEIPTDADIYTDIRASITAAMTRAGGGPTTTDGGTTDGTESAPVTPGGSTDGGVVGQALNSIGPKEADQVPMPVIILGVLFGLLILAGVGGLIAQRMSKKRAGGDPPAGETSAPETAV